MQSRGQRDYLFDFIHEEEATIAVVVVGLSYIDGHVAEPSTGCNYMVRDKQGFFFNSSGSYSVCSTMHDV